MLALRTEGKLLLMMMRVWPQYLENNQKMPIYLILLSLLARPLHLDLPGFFFG